MLFCSNFRVLLSQAVSFKRLQIEGQFVRVLVRGKIDGTSLHDAVHLFVEYTYVKNSDGPVLRAKGFEAVNQLPVKPGWGMQGSASPLASRFMPLT